MHFEAAQSALCFVFTGGPMSEETKAQSSRPEASAHKAGPKPGAKSGPTGPIIIKKYANRRLYNTDTSTYVTLEHLADMVKEGADFVVFDAKTNEDITRSVLTQIIFDEESRGQNLLPIQFLRQLIRFYGDSLQAFLPSYLELSLDSFARQNDRLKQQFAAMPPGLGVPGLNPATALGAVPMPGPQFLEDQVRQNMALFDRAMKMFSPFAYPPMEEPKPAAPQASATPNDSAGADASLKELKKRIEEMQEQIERLASKP
jgi:polyhydroxyalkanoate synthesis repressor PhaR